MRGAGELRVKESDRLAVMAAGLAALGVEHELLPDGMCIRGRPGPGPASAAAASTATATTAWPWPSPSAALRAGGAIEIDDIANVATSFPGFASLARGAGLALAEL